MLLKLDHLGLGVPTLLLHVPQGVLGAEADVDVLRDEEEGGKGDKEDGGYDRGGRIGGGGAEDG